MSTWPYEIWELSSHIHAEVPFYLGCSRTHIYTYIEFSFQSYYFQFKIDRLIRRLRKITSLVVLCTQIAPHSFCGISNKGACSKCGKTSPVSLKSWKRENRPGLCNLVVSKCIGHQEKEDRSKQMRTRWIYYLILDKQICIELDGSV